MSHCSGFCVFLGFSSITSGAMNCGVPIMLLDNMYCCVVQMTEVLRFLKKKKIIHLDIKPSNILVHNDTLLKLCDFGSSKLIKKNMEVIKVTGTPDFMAPEVLKENEKNTENPEQCDVWSIG